MFFCADLHCSSILLYPVINWFHSFKTHTQHKKYNTPTTCLYKTLIQHVQHALIKHKVVVKLLSEILQDRPEGITLFWIYFRINLTQEDARTKRDPFFFQFSMRLPQAISAKKRDKEGNLLGFVLHTSFFFLTPL